MARKLLILGESGTGKTYSARNLDPKTTFIICPDKKELPFRGWRSNYKEEYNASGKLDISKSNLFNSDNPTLIEAALEFISKNRPDIKTVLIDTISLMMVNDFMSQALIKGYDKYTSLALNTYNVFKKIDTLRPDLTVIVFAHVEKDNEGQVDIFIPGGKLIKEKARPVAMFTIVLETYVDFKEGKTSYLFMTQNNGKNVAKSPAGMFPSFLIDNDLKEVIDCIEKYEN